VRAAVIMTAFDRPHYLKRVLASLDKLDGLCDLPLFFYVDGPYDEGSAERCAESARLCKEFNHPQKTVIVRDKNVGIATQVYESKQAVFSSGYDAVVSLVDDIIIAPYGLEAMLTAYTTLQPYLALFHLGYFQPHSCYPRRQEIPA
jgi:GT2 family glycosyltransferase